MYKPAQTIRAAEVLSRSLEGDWEGVRIPRGVVDEARSERECALDIFCNACDLLPEELYLIWTYFDVILICRNLPRRVPVTRVRHGASARAQLGTLVAVD